jgi:hypothetical protein
MPANVFMSTVALQAPVISLADVGWQLQTQDSLPSAAAWCLTLFLHVHCVLQAGV